MLDFIILLFLFSPIFNWNFDDHVGHWQPLSQSLWTYMALVCFYFFVGTIDAKIFRQLEQNRCCKRKMCANAFLRSTFFQVVLKSGSVRVGSGSGSHFSGSGHVRVTIFRFLSGNYTRLTIVFLGVFGFSCNESFECRFGYKVGSGLIISGLGHSSWVSGFGAPNLITNQVLKICKL